MFDPVTAVIAGGAALGSSILGSRAQKKANKRAAATAATAEAQRLGLSREQFEFAKELINEGKPIRDALRESQLQTIPAFSEASQESLGLLRRFAAGSEGDPNTQLRINRDIESIQAGLAPFGLTDSSTAGTAVGEAAILRRFGEFDRRQTLRRQLVGLAPGGGTDMSGIGANISGQATDLMGQAGTFAGIRSQIASQSPTAGLFSDISTAATAFVTQKALKGGGGLQTGEGFF